MATVYPDEILSVINACEEYLAKKRTLESLKTKLLQSAGCILEVGESEYRCFLEASEGDLELILFTKQNFDSHADPVVRNIISVSKKHLDGSTSD